jgi:hypothetical protein
MAALARFHFRALLFSLAGLLFLLLALAFYQVFFAPGQRTPDADYVIFVLGIFGAAYSFLVTLTISARAYSSSHTIFYIRLESRVEYLVSVLISGLLFATLVQFLIFLLAVFVGEAQFGGGSLLEIPPLWLSVNILGGILALAASDWASDGWSRSWLFGLLLVLLFAQGNGPDISRWLAGRMVSLSSWSYGRQLFVPGDLFQGWANWLHGNGLIIIDRLLGSLFWPFRAIGDAITAHHFSPSQALAPAALVIYATLLFLLVSRQFAHKDLILTE